MAKVTGQKEKLLRLKDIFEQKTDEDHPMSIKEILDELEKFGIVAERKSIYRDIDTLCEYGMDICSRREKHYVYYLASREFEPVELKLITDAVSASKFIPKKYSKNIIKKLGRLTSEYGAKRLDRQLYAEKTTDNEMSTLLYNVDAVYRAIDSDSKIQFKYYDYTMRKTQRYRKDGAYYVTSPWALLWNDGMYYLIGYDSELGTIKHYRVDRMDKTIINESLRRDGKQAFKDFEIDEYKRHFFGMYNGGLTEVKLLCHESLANVIIDRFDRKKLIMYPVSDDYFEVLVKVAVSPVFLSWAAGFGDKLVIVSPEEVRDEMRKMIKGIAEVYGV